MNLHTNHEPAHPEAMRPTLHPDKTAHPEQSGQRFIGRVVEGCRRTKIPPTTPPSTARPGKALGRFAQGERCLMDSIIQ
jgi:hypothetical protein